MTINGLRFQTLGIALPGTSFKSMGGIEAGEDWVDQKKSETKAVKNREGGRTRDKRYNYSLNKVIEGRRALPVGH